MELYYQRIQENINSLNSFYFNIISNAVFKCDFLLTLFSFRLLFVYFSYVTVLSV